VLLLTLNVTANSEYMNNFVFHCHGSAVLKLSNWDTIHIRRVRLPFTRTLSEEINS